MKLNIFPHYTQFDAMDCGPTCLKMISKFYGRTFTLQNLRERSFISREGVSLLGLSDAAESIGFRTNGIRITLDQMVHEVPLPCILHWNQNHFVICYKIKRKKILLSSKKEKDFDIYIADPKGDKYVLNKGEFTRCWISSRRNNTETGIALLLTPTPEFYVTEDDTNIQQKNLSFYLGYLRPYKSQIFQLFLGMLLGSLISIIFPFLTQSIVDQGIGNSNLPFITLVLIAQLILFITQMTIGFIQNWITLHMNARISIALISDFLAKLMKLPIRFFDAKNVGDIMQRIGDHSRIQSFMTGSAITTIYSSLNVILFTCILAYYNLTILGVFLLGNILYVCWVISFMRYRRKLDHRRFTQSSSNQSSLIQLVTGMQDIKLNNCEKKQRWMWEKIQILLFKTSIKSTALNQFQQSGTIFFSQTTALIITFLSAKAVIEGHITLGMLMSISYIIGQLSVPIGQITNFIQTFQDAKLSLERLNEVHNKEDEEDSLSAKKNTIPNNEDITFKNVYFNYNGADRDYILDDLSLVIPAKKITAIVGVSGSGKTTIVKLLLGFYAPLKGHLMIGDTEIKDINPFIWRNKTGAVLQDSFIYSDTIANNIAISEEEINKDKLIRATEIANLEDFIDPLPLRFNTKIGIDGNGISQGQKQRILIARVVYKDPDFIFFDEATNSLDANNEKIIMDNLNDYYKGKTVVIVAHRLSTVQNADNIIVIDKGRVLEEGNHQQLIKLKGAYYTLVKNQLELGT